MPDKWKRFQFLTPFLLSQHEATWTVDQFFGRQLMRVHQRRVLVRLLRVRGQLVRVEVRHSQVWRTRLGCLPA